MMLVIDFHVLVLQLLMDNKLNFKVLLYKMLLIQLVVQTVNITYTAVSSIELRNPNGFEVYNFSFLNI